MSINKYLEHSLSNPMVNEYIKGKETLFLSLPICPRCERTGLRDKGWALNRIMSCPHCGYRGHATHQVSTYIQEGLYK